MRTCSPIGSTPLLERRWRCTCPGSSSPVFLSPSSRGRPPRSQRWLRPACVGESDRSSTPLPTESPGCELPSARRLELAEQRGVKTMDQVNLAFIDGYRSLRAKTDKAAKTVYNETMIIRQLVNFALSREMMFADSLKDLKLAKPKPTPQPCWTLEEVQQILAHSPAAEKPALSLLTETGMRYGELAWLTWEDVDWAKNVLLIRPKEGWKPTTGDQRNIPISAAARALLETMPRCGRWVTTRRYLKSDRQWTGEVASQSTEENPASALARRQAPHLSALFHQQRALEGGSRAHGARMGGACRS